MKFITWLNSIFAWNLVHSTGVWEYYENKVSGRRRAVRMGSGRQPLRKQWLAGGSWDHPRGSPPNQGSRANISERRFIPPYRYRAGTIKSHTTPGIDDTLRFARAMVSRDEDVQAALTNLFEVLSRSEHKDEI